MKELNVGDVTNYGLIKGFTVNGNYIINNGGVVGVWRNVFKINIKSQEEIELLTKSPIQ
jgi:hypothetical protein